MNPVGDCKSNFFHRHEHFSKKKKNHWKVMRNNKKMFTSNFTTVVCCKVHEQTSKYDGHSFC